MEAELLGTAWLRERPGRGPPPVSRGPGDGVIRKKKKEEKRKTYGGRGCQP